MRYPPLQYYLERVLRHRGGGGISHWAAKRLRRLTTVCFKMHRTWGPGGGQCQLRSPGILNVSSVVRMVLSGFEGFLYSVRGMILTLAILQ